MAVRRNLAGRAPQLARKGISSALGRAGDGAAAISSDSPGAVRRGRRGVGGNDANRGWSGSSSRHDRAGFPKGRLGSCRNATQEGDRHPLDAAKSNLLRPVFVSARTSIVKWSAAANHETAERTFLEEVRPCHVDGVYIRRLL